MGTNYYAILDQCPTCGRGDERLHIGKSSAGWCFSLQTHKAYEIHSLRDWAEFLRDRSIVDEYGKPVKWVNLLENITMRHHPRGLQRHPLEHGCIGHGVGTYDLFDGREFS